MKFTMMSVVLAMLLSGAAVLAHGDKEEHADAPATQPSTQPAEAVNKTCPVGGEAIDPQVTIEHEGKTIAFCCKDCIEDFKKDPEKYTKDLK